MKVLIFSKDKEVKSFAKSSEHDYVFYSNFAALKDYVINAEANLGVGSQVVLFLDYDENELRSDINKYNKEFLKDTRVLRVYFGSDEIIEELHAHKNSDTPALEYLVKPLTDDSIHEVVDHLKLTNPYVPQEQDLGNSEEDVTKLDLSFRTLMAAQEEGQEAEESSSEDDLSLEVFEEDNTEVRGIVGSHNQDTDAIESKANREIQESFDSIFNEQELSLNGVDETPADTSGLPPAPEQDLPSLDNDEGALSLDDDQSSLDLNFDNVSDLQEFSLEGDSADIEVSLEEDGGELSFDDGEDDDLDGELEKGHDYQSNSLTLGIDQSGSADLEIETSGTRLGPIEALDEETSVESQEGELDLLSGGMESEVLDLSDGLESEVASDADITREIEPSQILEQEASTSGDHELEDHQEESLTGEQEGAEDVESQDSYSSFSFDVEEATRETMETSLNKFEDDATNTFVNEEAGQALQMDAGASASEEPSKLEQEKPQQDNEAKSVLNFLKKDDDLVPPQVSESEALHFQATIRQLREEREELLTQINKQKQDLALWEQDNLGLKAELDEVKIEVSIMKKRSHNEIEDMKYRLSLAEEKKVFAEEKAKRLDKEFARLENKVRINIGQVQQREKELEGQLELIKMDSESQVQTRDKKILELKRQIDQLEFNMEHAVIREEKSRQDKLQLEDRLDKIMRTLRGSIEVLEDDLSWKSKTPMGSIDKDDTSS